MNLLFILLSIFFSTVSPSFTNNEGTTENQGSRTKQHMPSGSKNDKIGNGDFIIGSDGHP